MFLILNIIVLLFEVFYYSLFMKFSRKEGSIFRYLILFTLITLFFTFVGTKHLCSYLFLVILVIYGLKYIVKLKVSLYDMLVIVIMLCTKVILEIPLYYLFSLAFNGVISTMLFEVIKISLLLFLRNRMSKYYLLLKAKWDNNNFYIRYLFTIALFIYVIASCIFLVVR